MNRAYFWLIGGTLGTLILTVGSSELMLELSAREQLHELPIWMGIIIGLIWLSAFFIAIGIALWVVRFSVPKTGQPAQFIINRILFSYLCLIFVFAGIYYSMACLGDYNDAVGKRIDYKSMYKPIMNNFRISDHHRAFRGIENRRWRGVEQVALRRYSQFLKEDEIVEIPIDDLRRAADEMGDDHIESDPKGGRLLFIDCVYFSTATIVTLGYGDISPRAWYAKLASCLEVLSGLYILSISLGTYFSSKATKTEEA